MTSPRLKKALEAWASNDDSSSGPLTPGEIELLAAIDAEPEDEPRFKAGQRVRMSGGGNDTGTIQSITANIDVEWDEGDPGLYLSRNLEPIYGLTCESGPAPTLTRMAQEDGLAYGPKADAADQVTRDIEMLKEAEVRLDESRALRERIEAKYPEPDLRDAVVEAARWLLNDNLPLQMRVDRIVEAVRALERKGE